DNWSNRAALERLAAEAPVTGSSPQILTALACRLRVAGAETERLLREAQRRHTDDFWLNFELGATLAPARPADAAGFFRAALVARPESSEVYNRLGLTLAAQRQFDEAVAAYQQALALDPNSSPALTNLGMIYYWKGETREAIAAARR